MTPAAYQQARARLGLTHDALADMLGVHPVTSRDYGTKATPPESIRRLLAAIEALGIDRARDLFKRT